jgi:hypothetical protein
MADATEIRSDNPSAEAPTESATEAVTAAAPAVEAALPAIEIVAAPETDKPVETPAVIEVAAQPAAARAAFLNAWLATFRASAATTMSAARPALLAGGIGFAAGAGLLLATIGIMGIGNLGAAPTPAPAPWATAAEETRAVKQTVVRLEAQVAEIKASIDAATRNANTQRAQIADRDQRNTRTQGEMQSRLVKIGESLERLEKRVVTTAATENAGAPASTQAATAAAPPHAEARAAPPKLAVVEGWTIRDVFRGRALVVSRRGVYEAAPGLHLPELGRVEAVTRENGRWVVITEKGIITVHRRMN